MRGSLAGYGRVFGAFDSFVRCEDACLVCFVCFTRGREV